MMHGQKNISTVLCRNIAPNDIPLHHESLTVLKSAVASVIQYHPMTPQLLSVWALTDTLFTIKEKFMNMEGTALCSQSTSYKVIRVIGLTFCSNRTDRRYRFDRR